MVGQTISHYRITAKLGEGGMGVVYKAEDTKLERTVALKFLAAHLLNDEEAKERFLREAKAAAALDHPNICTVYEINEVDGKTFIAMAFLEGDSLEDRISNGPLPLKDSLEIARQVADGLQAAHGKGVFHRDIKPANVLISPEGLATVMDFGLARLTEASRLTKHNTAMGTVAYMSPEQAQGMDVDSRSDLWSLGCVLYEMVSGQRPFQGQYDQALLYEIVHEEPAALTGLRTGVPIELELLASKCLAKDRDDRYQSAKEIAVDVRTLAEKLKSGRSTIVRTTNLAAAARATVAAAQTLTPTEALPPGAVVVQRSTQRALQAVAAVAAIAVLGLAFLYFGQAPPPSPPTVEFSVAVPEGLRAGQLGVSPDGRHLVMSVRPRGSLWVRSLDSVEWREFTGTQGARFPFWSPDNTEIGFFADERLKKVALAGGPSQTITEAPDGRGGSWGANGTILFLPTPFAQVHSIAESGGEPIAVTEEGEGAGYPRFPHLLPDGRHFLYEVSGTSPEKSGIHLGSLDGDSPRRLLPDASNVLYVPSGAQASAGFLLFVREGTLMAQTFDASRMELSGGPIALPAAPPFAGNAGFYGFSASATGVLAYSSAPNAGPQRLVWVDRAGAAVDRTDLVADRLSTFSLAPDGTRAAYSAVAGGNLDIWTYDLMRQTRIRLSDQPGNDHYPVWSPDGTQVAFRSTQPATFGDIYLSQTDGSNAPVALLSETSEEFSSDWSNDGRFILYSSRGEETLYDLWYLERATSGDSWDRSFS